MAAEKVAPAPKEAKLVAPVHFEPARPNEPDILSANFAEQSKLMLAATTVQNGVLLQVPLTNSLAKRRVYAAIREDGGSSFFDWSGSIRFFLTGIEVLRLPFSKGTGGPETTATARIGCQVDAAPQPALACPNALIIQRGGNPPGAFTLSPFEVCVAADRCEIFIQLWGSNPLPDNLVAYLGVLSENA